MAIVSKFLIVWTLLELYNAAFTVSETSPDECLPTLPAPGGIGARSPRPSPLSPTAPAAGLHVRAAVDLLVWLGEAPGRTGRRAQLEDFWKNRCKMHGRHCLDRRE